MGYGIYKDTDKVHTGDYGQEILDCKFSPNGNDMVFLGGDGNFTSRGFGQTEKHSMIVEGGKEILFSNTGNRMHIAVEGRSFSGLYTYSYRSNATSFKIHPSSIVLKILR